MGLEFKLLFIPSFFAPLSPLLLFIFAPLPASCPSLAEPAAVCEAGAAGAAVCKADPAGAVGGPLAPPQRAPAPQRVWGGTAPPGGKGGP